MIGSIHGHVLFKVPPRVTIEAGGLGYEIEAPMSTYFHLPEIGAQVRLLTHLYVREDAHVLYGFRTEEERQLFRSLIKVSGVGPKIALALLSGVSVEAFARCVRHEDVQSLTRVPGIGRRIAERLVVEMRDRIGADGGEQLHASVPGEGPEREAFDALVTLGYKPLEATRLLKAVGRGEHSTEELIRRALQGAARD